MFIEKAVKNFESLFLPLQQWTRSQSFKAGSISLSFSFMEQESWTIPENWKKKKKKGKLFHSFYEISITFIQNKQDLKDENSVTPQNTDVVIKILNRIPNNGLNNNIYSSRA